MAIPKGLVSVARGSGVARKLLDIAAELKLEPSVVRTTTNYGYLVPEKVAEKYEADLAKGTPYSFFTYSIKRNWTSPSNFWR